VSRQLPVLHAGPAIGVELSFGLEARLGEKLAERGFLEPESIPAILKAQARWGCRFGEAMIAQGAITPIELAAVLADSCGLPFADLIVEPPEENLYKTNEIDLYLRHLFFPWRSVGGAPVIACVDPSPGMRALAQRLYGPRALLAVTAKFDVIWTVQRIFRETLGHDATFRLDERAPRYSARRVTTRAQRVA